MEERVHNLLLVLALITTCFNRFSLAQVAIPASIDGFVYKGGFLLPTEKTVVVEAFFDPMCPDSKAAWPSFKQAIKHYSPRISLTLHTFTLPYHDNSFVASRALHIANKLNTTTTYPLLELLFKHQEKYGNKATHELSRASIIEDITKLASKVTGKNSLSQLKSGFQDLQTDKATRISFKYGCSRGVTGTPYFFINGFPLLDDGSPLDYKKWKLVFDPLVHKQ